MPDDRFVHIHMSVEISPVRGRLPWGSNPRIVERAALRIFIYVVGIIYYSTTSNQGKVAQAGS